MSIRLLPAMLATACALSGAGALEAACELSDSMTHSGLARRGASSAINTTSPLRDPVTVRRAPVTQPTSSGRIGGVAQTGGEGFHLDDAAWSDHAGATVLDARVQTAVVPEDFLSVDTVVEDRSPSMTILPCWAQGASPQWTLGWNSK